MPAYTTYTESFLRLFYPHLCKACGNEVFQNTSLLCWRCIENLPLTEFEKHAENPVKHLFTGRLHLQEACSWLYFSRDSITQAIIHRFKYQGQQQLAKYAGELMGRSLSENERYHEVDVIVPLPLNDRKLRQRGYNQAELLAQGIANMLHKPLDNSAVMRTRYTATQTKKNRIQRWINVEHVFDIQQQHQLQGKHVLLVDDVITTGASMEAMGAVLLKIPGLRLSVCSLAYASRI